MFSSRSIQLLACATMLVDALGSMDTHVIAKETYTKPFSYQADMGPFRRVGDNQVVLPGETKVSNLLGDGLEMHVKSMVQFPRAAISGANFALCLLYTSPSPRDS